MPFVMTSFDRYGLAFARTMFCLRLLAREGVLATVTNLVDPASSVRLFQRLSHACLSISFYMAKLRMAH